MKKMCLKCGSNGAVILNNKDVYCSACFLIYVTHKFRSTLGKHRVLEQDEIVMIAYSGGSSSAALMHLVLRGLSEQDTHSHRKLSFHPVIVHVSFGLEDDAIVSQLSKMNAKCPIYFVPFESLFDSQLTMIPVQNESQHFTTPPCHHPQRSVSLFNSINDVTVKRELLCRLRTYAIYRAAVQLGVEKIFFGDTMTSLAVDVFSHIAEGRGAQVAADCAVVDSRFPGVNIIRPMRELSSKEIALYNRLTGVEYYIEPERVSNAFLIPTAISDVSKHFAYGLQVGFPATIPTIFSTACKLSDNISKGTMAVCLICFSRFGESASALSENLSVKEIASNCVLRRFCYGCRTLIGNVANLRFFPSFVLL